MFAIRFDTARGLLSVNRRICILMVKFWRFYEARRNVPRIRIASPHLGYNLDDWAWGDDPSRIMLPVVAVQLHQLREIYVQPKAVRHSSSVKIDGLRMRSARSCRT